MADDLAFARTSFSSDHPVATLPADTPATDGIPDAESLWLQACETYFANVCHWGVFLPPDIRDQCVAWGRRLAWDWPRFHAACDQARMAPAHPPRTMRHLLRIVGDYLPAASQWAAWITDVQTVWPRGWNPAQLVTWLPEALAEAARYHWSLTTPADPKQVRRMRLLLSDIQRRRCGPDHTIREESL